jgi:PAS domain S-box-containing protein
LIKLVDVKILLVEDESIAARDIKRTLESFDYEVPYVASTGDEAVEKAIEILPDLILMDIGLKGESDGIEAASKIKDLNIPVIFLTAHSEASTVQKEKLMEPYGYLLNPHDVKELKLTIEMALSKHEMGQRLKEVINGSPIPQFFIDNDHRVVYWNKALEKYSGIKAEVIVGTDQHWRVFYSEKRPCMVDLLVDNDLEKLQEWYQDKYSESELVDGAFEATDFFPKLGEGGKWLYFTATAIKDSKDGVIGALETLEDVTDRIMAEKALLKSEERFRALAHSAIDGIITTNLNGKIILLNESLQNIFGYNKDELVGESVTMLMPERYQANFQNKLDKFKETGEHELAGKTFETTGLRKDGTEFPFEMSLSTWEASGEKFTSSIIRDITERTEAEEALRESERNYRELVGNSMVAIYKTNLKGDILFANDAMVELFDFESAEALKTKKASLLYKNPNDRKKIIEKLRKEGSFSHHEVDMVSNSGDTITILLSAHLEDNIISGMMMDLTERKKSEKKLERSENRYRAIFENSGTGILTFANDGTIIMSNHEWEKLSGYSREEVEGKMKWMEIVHPDYLEKMMEYHRRRVKDPDSAPQEYETVFIKKSGDLLVVYVNVTPLPGTDIWLASALDITDLKNTQKKLEKSVLRFRALAEYALDGIITTDAHGKILYFNNSLLKMFGYSKDELQNSQLTILMPVRYRENFMKSLRKFRSTGEHRLVGRTIETTGLKKYGDEFPFEMSLTKWETDKKIYFTSIIRDITERKVSEKALLDSEEKFRKVFNKSNDAITLSPISEDGTLGRYIEVNDVMCQVLGYSREELLKMTPMDIVSPDWDEMPKNAAELLDKGKATFESIHVSKDGHKRPVEISAYIFTLKGKKVSIATIRDLTERKKAEDDLKESLKEKEILLREIHHRVKNNMEIISSLLKLQIKQVEEEEAENVLKESQGRVKSMAMIHEKLYQSKSFTKINFKNYVENLVNDIFYSYGIKKGTIEPKLEIENINIDIDTLIPVGLIINELVTNSVKYAFPKGKGTIKIKLRSNQDQLELIIADNGVGLPDEMDYKNTDSLGLQLVNGLVYQIDGEIELQRSQGTEYKITFKELEPRK